MILNSNINYVLPLIKKKKSYVKPLKQSGLKLWLNINIIHTTIRARHKIFILYPSRCRHWKIQYICIAQHSHWKIQYSFSQKRSNNRFLLIIAERKRPLWCGITIKVVWNHPGRPRELGCPSSVLIWLPYLLVII